MIRVSGAREHNLKNITLEIPREKMVVITGLSGSGKSTLAFDLLFAEGQRRFLDVMSPYARQFVEQLEKPDVDAISGLPPTVAIEQRVTRGGGKSTVATVTEVYHFLRLLFAKLGTQHCPDCGCVVEKQTTAEVARQVAVMAKGGRVQLFAPVIRGRKGFHTEVAKWARNEGFETLVVDGKLCKVDAFPKLERFREHTIEVLIGEWKGKATMTKELQAVIARGLEIGKGTIRAVDAKGRNRTLSNERACPECGVAFDALDPRLFSYNSPHGWCLECQGFGEVWKHSVNKRLETQLERELDKERQGENLEEGEAKVCPSCDGARVNPQARAVRLHGKTIFDLTSATVNESLALVQKWKFTGGDKTIAQDVAPEIVQRLKFMDQVGLGYLGLHRSARTLSGGESQRIRLSAQLGSNLRGVLYILDEPSIGLHPRDNDALLATLDSLKKKGNSLVIVEHDEETMRQADVIVDLGPGAGVHGGEVVAQGTLKEIIKSSQSATGRYLSNPPSQPTRGSRRPINDVQWIEVAGAKVNNLKDITVKIPVGRLSVITGVSGSGKSTFMRGVLKPAITNALAKKGKKPTAMSKLYSKLSGVEHIGAVQEVDQSPIGKTSRSTPATYIGVFDHIRALFAQIPLARMRGYTASRFSFNTDGGRCETCVGQGVIKMEMAFLPTSFQMCSTCHGKRFNAATIEVLYNDKSIGDVMDMSLATAADFFKAHPKIHRPLQLLCDTGLGYLRLGQASPTLSGGEAQRLKLVTELVQGVSRDVNARLRMKQNKSTLYLLEEPSIGLHMADVMELLKVIHRLVDDGGTVVIIEHNIEVIADADYLVDIGPEAGDAGGKVVATGTPEQLAKHKISRIAPFLRRVLR